MQPKEEEKEIQEMVEEFDKLSEEDKQFMLALMDSIILEESSIFVYFGNNTKH